MKNICVVGVGYIGLPTALVFAKAHNSVVGYDLDLEKVNSLNDGRTSFSESELSELLGACLASGHLKFSTDPTYADVFIICVPSPNKIANGTITQDTSFIFSAIDRIAPFTRNTSHIVIETTSKVGITEKISKYYFSKYNYNKGVSFAYCAERIIPGELIQELYSNDRVLGIDDRNKAQDLYKIYRKALPKVHIDILSTRSAEAVKLIENSFRDVNIAYANSVYNLCYELNIEPMEVLKVANRHPRVTILQPSFGVGGHCIPVDPWFLITGNEETASLLLEARKINTQATNLYIKRLFRFCEQILQLPSKDIEVLFLGCTYKPDVDDLRESPALTIINKVTGIFKRVYVCEPMVQAYSLKKYIEGVELVELDKLSRMKRNKVLVPLVSHSIFRKEYGEILSQFKHIYDPYKTIQKD